MIPVQYQKRILDAPKEINRAPHPPHPSNILGEKHDKITLPKDTIPFRNSKQISHFRSYLSAHKFYKILNFFPDQIDVLWVEFHALCSSLLYWKWNFCNVVVWCRLWKEAASSWVRRNWAKRKWESNVRLKVVKKETKK